MNLRIKNDPVYQQMCKALNVDADTYLYRDPYHRYERAIKLAYESGYLKKNQTILDVGCLRPELASLLIHQFNSKLTGIDQWEMSDKWSGFVDMKFYNFNLADDFPRLFTEQFDVIFALEVLEHMTDTDAFLERLKSILKPGGALIISTPNINTLRNRLMVPFGYYPIQLEYKNILHHVRLYNGKALVSHLTEKGFKVKQLKGVNFLPYRGPMTNKLYRTLSEKLANRFPTLCMNLIAISTK